MESITFGFIASGLLVGTAFGFVLQRGRFCMNSAFRDTIFLQDFTLFRAYLFALLIMIVGANFLEDMGLMTLRRQTFYPLANIVGGYIFGMGIVLAGGCGSGILYRTGEGHLASWFAVFGFFLGIGASSSGILSPIVSLFKGEGLSFSLAGKTNPALWELAGDGNVYKWGAIVFLVIVLLPVILKGSPISVTKQKGYYWSVTAVLVGIIGVIAFWASEHWGSPGAARGLSFTKPTSEMFFTILTGEANSNFPMYKIGSFVTSWAALYIIGVPLGAYISARLLKEFAWKVSPPKELLTVLAGSLMMGFGAVLAGGCNIGQGLTGFATLSIGSIVATVFIILGNWTMVYFKFMR